MSELSDTLKVMKENFPGRHAILVRFFKDLHFDLSDSCTDKGHPETTGFKAYHVGVINRILNELKELIN